MESAPLIQAPASFRMRGDKRIELLQPLRLRRARRLQDWAAFDPLAVVDARRCVIGLESLRVIDASVVPTITPDNTNTPTIVIAARGARFVLGR